MLNQLSIANYILIEDIKIPFENGLTIITGETGAGKSILLGALRLIMGDKADVKSLRDEQKKCVIEAIFDISKLELEDFFDKNELDFEKQTIIRREIGSNGKSRIFINDSPSNQSVVQELSNKLLDIHSQFSNHQLKDPIFHLQIVDSLVLDKSILKNYKEKFGSFKSIDQKLKKLIEEFSHQNQNTEYNLYLLDELQKADFKEEEQEELENEQKLLLNASDIISALDKSCYLVDNEQAGALHSLNEILHQLNGVSNNSSTILQFKERIQSVAIELKDILDEMTSFSTNFEVNPVKLEEITHRINLLYQLQSKHKVNSINELIEIKNQLEKRTQNTDEISFEIQQLKIEKEKVLHELQNLATQLTDERKNVLPMVENELEKTLIRMGIENAKFSFEIEKSEFSSMGQDKIRLFFCANKGGKLEPIDKVASGGEIARVSLAIKKLIAKNYYLPTLVLDEIDTGISGKTAHQMGEIMQEMSQNMQLITITHNPQIAAKGENHLKVYKRQEEEKTKPYIEALTNDQKILEIAQLISGHTVSETALAQAKQLVENN